MAEFEDTDVEICNDDLFVQGIEARNRALHGDLVTLELLPPEASNDGLKDGDPGLSSSPSPQGQMRGRVVHVSSVPNRGRKARFFGVLRANRTAVQNKQIREQLEQIAAQHRRERASTLSSRSGKPRNYGEKDANRRPDDDGEGEEGRSESEDDLETNPELTVVWKKDRSLKAICSDKRIPWFFIPMQSVRDALINQPTPASPVNNVPAQHTDKLKEKSADGEGDITEPIAEPGVSSDLGPLALSSPALSEYDLFEFRFKSWASSSALPEGELVRHVGRQLDTRVEEFIAMANEDLLEHRTPYTPAVEEYTKQAIEELERDFEKVAASRVDLRLKNIFTIDPATARDLDDAIHIEFINDRRKWTWEMDEEATRFFDSQERGGGGGGKGKVEGFYEVGVHIADVSYFVHYQNPIDMVAGSRTTTIYLPHKAYHMLPRALCEQVCSLVPNGPKLAFSCLFFMRLDGTMIEGLAPKVFRSVIHSRYQLNYDQVQDVLDANRSEDNVVPGQAEAFTATLVAKVESGDLREWTRMTEHKKYKKTALVQDLLLLEDLTQKIRRLRFDEGGLRLQKLQLRFNTDSFDMPTSIRAETHSASHEMIEELMLAANETVSKVLVAGPLRQLAVLRYHPALDAEKVESLCDQVNALLAHHSSSKTSPAFKLAVPSDLAASSTGTKSGGIRDEQDKRKKAGEAGNNGEALEEAKRLRAASKALMAMFEQIKAKFGPKIFEAIQQCCVEKMALAKYGVFGHESFESSFHYGLGFLTYTHFTSPIRRYPDIMVHRLLHATIELGKLGVYKPDQIDLGSGESAAHKYLDSLGCASVENLNGVCELSNVKKLAARKVQEATGAAWLLMWLDTQPQPVVGTATVLAILDKSMMVFMPEFDVKTRVEYVCKGDERATQKTRKKYLKTVERPTQFQQDEQANTCVIRWADGASQKYTLLDSIDVYVLPTKDLPVRVDLVPCRTSTRQQHKTSR